MIGKNGGVIVEVGGLHPFLGEDFLGESRPLPRVGLMVEKSHPQKRIIRKIPYS